ncbi:hypothetical protein OMP38_18955 [Cohnella ginsengisoli]|uniref:Uncharacterized protein n=1 Tax=Cohnella ginsengisoli TaxID=425004 RepID=A0A9X4QN32_9BACL|nr:hypothetical protein [Cohnella ginsengisoli]MDG0792724.1 hypothetical protein [Cohnella ginsengisoli]
MTYTEKTRIGIIFKNEAARAVLIRRLPDLLSSPPHMLSLFKSLTLEKVYAFRQEELGQSDWIAKTLAELAEVASDHADAEPIAEAAPSAEYEPADVPEASAAVQAPDEAEQWGVYEIAPVRRRGGESRSSITGISRGFTR